MFIIYLFYILTEGGVEVKTAKGGKSKKGGAQES